MKPLWPKSWHSARPMDTGPRSDRYIVIMNGPAHHCPQCALGTQPAPREERMGAAIGQIIVIHNQYESTLRTAPIAHAWYWRPARVQG